MIQSLDLEAEIDGEKVVVRPADEALASAEETVLKGPGPDLIVSDPTE